MEALELSIVIPALNEEESLRIFIPEIEEAFRQVKHEIIVVDDNSSDDTGGLILRLNKMYGNLRLITRNNKRGIGSALREGYDNARARIILSSDADLSFSVTDMKKMFEKINQGYDFVVGCRHNIPGSYYEMKGLCAVTKGLLSKFGNTVLKILTRSEINDFSANFRAITKDAWGSLGINENSNAMLFEMIVKARHKRLKITQIPVIFLGRVYGKSKLNLVVEIPKAALKAIYYLFKTLNL